MHVEVREQLLILVLLLPVEEDYLALLEFWGFELRPSYLCGSDFIH